MLIFAFVFRLLLLNSQRTSETMNYLEENFVCGFGPSQAYLSVCKGQLHIVTENIHVMHQLSVPGIIFKFLIKFHLSVFPCTYVPRHEDVWGSEGKARHVF